MNFNGLLNENKGKESYVLYCSNDVGWCNPEILNYLKNLFSQFKESQDFNTEELEISMDISQDEGFPIYASYQNDDISYIMIKLAILDGKCIIKNIDELDPDEDIPTYFGYDFVYEGDDILLN